MPFRSASSFVAAAALFERQHEAYLVLGQQPVEDPEIHVVFLHAAGKLSGDVVSDHPRQLHKELFLFGVVAVVIRYGIVPLVHVDLGVDFLDHMYRLLKIR